MTTRRNFLIGSLAIVTAPAMAQSTGDGDAWRHTLELARGRSVFFNAWGGDERTNAFIDWARERLRAVFGVDLRHVRLGDTAEAVQRVIAEKVAGRNTGGSVDLIWINGSNLLAMKDRGLLFGPFTKRLPSFQFVDVAGKPATVTDFTIPVDGYAAPWRMAQIVFVYDSARLQSPPRTMRAMLDWARGNPGRLTHPSVRDFHGITFLKQALYELTSNAQVLQRPVGADYELAVAPLWDWYGDLRPLLWRRGRQFPESGPAQRQLIADGEIDLMISFNPAEAAVSIANGLLPPTAKVYVLDGGTIGNASFLAIPINAANRDAAMVVAEFLLGAEAQARMSDPRELGSPSVLDIVRLPPEGKRHFTDLPTIPGMPGPTELGRVLPEPHPSWMVRIIADWERRYTG